MRLEKVAIVTGASRGIGKAVALGLAKDGYNIVLIARNQTKLLEVEQEIDALGVKTKIICDDIANFDSISTALSEAIAGWGRVDVLVNNAGIYIEGLLEAPLEDYQRLLDVNFKAQVVMIKNVLPIMEKQKKGFIVNIASIAGKVGISEMGAYSSSKFALVGLSEALHTKYAKQGIKVTAICPGLVATDMTTDFEVPPSEMIQPEDIYKTIHYLMHLSPHAFVKEVIINTAS